MAGELAKAYVQIIPSAKGITDGIGKELGGEATKSGNTFGKDMVGTIKKVLAAAGIGEAIKKAINQGAELEQNLGGTEAVFGEFAKSIQDSATTAYKNMGLSASDYMATANKMGSLFQGSGVEQQRALDLTAQAMQRAADVASVMGIDTSMAMESIAGAAKGNFTMMDNLGVAMNATTLQAYALEKGINFKWNTASNAEKAELAMQMFFDRTEQYAGNFAREADQTISGSFEATKSALANLMGNLALGNDIMPSLQELVVQADAFLRGNLLPAIGNIFAGIGKTAADAILGVFGTDLESATGYLADVFSPVKDSISDLLDTISTVTEPIRTVFSEYVGSGQAAADITDAVKAALETASAAISAVIDGFSSFITWLNEGSTGAEVFKSVIVAIAAGFAAFTIISTVVSLFNTLKTALAAAKIAFAAVNAVMAANPIGIVITVITALVAGIIYLWNNCDSFREGLTAAWETLQSFFVGIGEGISGFISGAVDKWNSLKESFGQIGGTIKEKWSQTTDSIKSSWNNAMNSVKEKAKVGLDALRETTKSKLDNVKAAYVENGGGIKGAVAAAMTAVKETQAFGLDYIDTLTGGKLSSVADKFKEKMNDAKSAVSGALDNIKKYFSDKMEAARKAVTDVLDKIKSAFNFKWSLPELKIPHITVTGGVPPYGIGGKGSLPEFDIKWYRTGGILNGATIFGAMGNSLLGGGENGPEAVLPLREFYRELERIILSSRERTSAFNGSVSNRSVNVYQTIYSEAKTAADLMREARYQAEMAVLFGV